MENKELESPLEKPIVEDLATAAHVDVETTDENLTVNTMYQQSSLPSLGKQIFSVIPIHGPTGALFNLKKKTGTNDIELVRKNVEVYPSASVPTSITQEAVQDMQAMFGKEANVVIGKLLRGIANDAENVNTFNFLEANAGVDADLTLSNSLNAEVNLFEITQKVHELILKINSRNIRSYEAWAVIPYQALGGIMGLSQYAGADNKERGLFITQLGQTKFYLNPNSTTAIGTEATGVNTVVPSTNVTGITATTGIFENATLSIIDDGTSVTSVTSDIDLLDINGQLVAVAGVNLLPASVLIAAATTLTLTGAGTITTTVNGAPGAGGTATFDTTGAVAWSWTPSTKAYVGVKDSENPSKSSAVFSPFESHIVEALDSTDGSTFYNIYNRYAITSSPLHERGNEMMYKFNVII